MIQILFLLTPSNKMISRTESNIFKTCSNINSAKKRVFKADIILNSKKAKNNKSKHISKVYSDILINYHKIKKEFHLLSAMFI